ncbi:BTAD domain-containing putative transcriptional regulator [Streptomyces sp. NBC_00878]|uniref:AfsR/SARP family transcriptional regulator n=1 Tax=Streptomyces sp. NBC_00878 TaxID=2975854 RepID=UPI002254CF17|nr:BTAD domain-containing putative transcriptional regulator [Streptomyces sp. NBC_00878]MCX4902843.1 tetratricopeptide repeat protein [Streptomyces sp. NBC_00878]
MHTRFTVLGPLRAWRGGIELELGPPKQRALLAFLLAQPNHPVGTHEIVDALWRQNPPDSAVNVVHRHIGALRRLFEPDMPSRGTSRWLVRASGGYRLDADPESLDLLRFRYLRERASRTGEPAEATELLVEALTLWRGPTASGIAPEVRAHPAFGAVDGEHLAAVKHAAERALETGREPRARVLVTLRQAAALHMLDEALQARLILMLAATGHQAEALEVYRTVRARLADDLGVQPGPELQAAQRRVLAQTYVWDDSAPAEGTRSADHTSVDARTESAGTRRESETAGTDRESETAGTGRESETAGTGRESETAEPFDPDHRMSLVVPPAQLPAKLPSFTGRLDELARFRGLLPGSSASTVVISAIGGMAGVGKTALAVHWAHQVADRFPDGQLYVDLRGFHPSGTVMSPAEAIRSFLDALGVPAQRVPAGLDAQAALYRSLLARRRVLIVLDNARDTEHVRPLLPGAPGCLVVVTSRHQLYGLVAAEGAHFLTLDVLGEDDALRFLSDRLGPDRIARDPGAARAIVAACGGLPLALAVVSARAAINPAFPLSAIAEELAESEGSLHAFSGEAPTADARSAFSWSYRLLSPEAARVFRLFALHPGDDCSVAAAASLAGQRRAQVKPLLAELCRAHLVSETGPGRFGCHELLRAYGTELGKALDAPPERRAARRRMFDHYLHSAHAAAGVLATSRERLTLGPPLPGTIVSEFADQTRAAEWLETNRSVLLAAVEQSARRGCGEQSWQLAATIELYLDRNGRRQEQFIAQTTAARAAQRLGDLRGQAHAHRALGFANGRLERWEDAAEHLARALDLFADIGDQAGQGRVHRYAAFLANARGRHGEALEHYARAGVLYREAGRRSGEASVANEVGWTHILTGRYRKALEECGRALTVHQEIGDRNGAAAAWDSLGYAHHHLHEHDRALTCYEHALELYRAIRDRSLEADTLVHIGDSRYLAGEHERAADAWRQALDILDDIGHPDAEAVRGKLKDAAAAGAGEQPAHP